MGAYIVDMFSLVVRWLHIITGIAWVGASFYFIWLDNSLEEPPEWKKDKGIKGDLWSFHGGGIYEVAKYRLGPERMPPRLHWFYWEAYSTWLTGMALLVIVYYIGASSHLVSDSGPLSTPLASVLGSLAFIFSGFAIYELLLRGGVVNATRLFILCMAAMLTAYCWLSVQLFSARAAYLHVGILIGTIMVANVFFGIIPPQRRFVRDIEAGREPQAGPLLMAKLRSTHNNYFTLPVLFCMISNHYPFLYGHEYNWLLLASILGITAAAREFFNLRHRGIFRPRILVVCALLFLGLMSLLVFERYQEEQALAALAVDELEGMALVNRHCSGCHTENPGFPGFSAPPLGVILNSPEQVRQHAAKAREAVASNYMPLGNLSKMTPEERKQLVAWLGRL